MEYDSAGDLHQLYADMLGWDSMVATIANVYHHLPPSDQARCAILAGNYGEAGAIDFYGNEYGLPNAISGHNNYHFWGTRGCHAVTAENHLPVYVCRRPPHLWRFDARTVDTMRAMVLDGKCLRAKYEENHDLGYELLKRGTAVTPGGHEPDGRTGA